MIFHRKPQRGDGNTAQGEALGTEDEISASPERAKYSYAYRAPSGLSVIASSNPVALTLGCITAAPSGLY